MQVKSGSTDVTTYFTLRDSTNHAPKTDITVTDLDLYYIKDRTAISAKADATALAAADSAHSDNKAYHAGQGSYRIDWPDDAFSGAVGTKVQLIVVCTGVDTTFLEVELSPAVDTTSIGGTTQTARDLGASVLLSSGTGTGQISLSSGQVTVTTNNDKTGYGLADNAIAAAKIASDAITAIQAGLSTLTSAQVNTECDNALADVGLTSTITGRIDAAISTRSTLTAAQVWDTLLSSITTVNTIGKLIKDYLDAAISSRSSLAASDIRTALGMSTNNLDTQLSGINSKTTNLPASPAAVSDIPTASGIADAVLDEALSGHATSGSLGKIVNQLNDSLPESSTAPTTRLEALDVVLRRFTRKVIQDSDSLDIYNDAGSAPLLTQSIVKTESDVTVGAITSA